MQKQVTAIAPGSKVRIGQGITADVVEVSIGNGLAVQYRCVWFVDSDLKDCWLASWQVEQETGDELRIGFNHAAKHVPGK